MFTTYTTYYAKPMDDELIAGLDLLRERPAATRKRGLTVDRVVAAAVELADAEGIDAVSMSRVAERLGFTTMSLYRHVRGKDELVLLMVNAAAGAPPEYPEGTAWRERLELWSWELLARMRAHPWVLSLPISRPPWAPSQLAWLDRGLAALADTKLDEDEKASVVLLLNGHVFGQARFHVDLGDPQSFDTYVEGLADLLDSARFPALRRAIDAGIFAPSEDDADTDFAFGLDRVLDGVERLVTQRNG
jgi:AcrR family transcriptional regulator